VIGDRRQVGWIAQDVEVYFPKSVTRQDIFGVEDLALLDVDQLYKCAYGALGHALQKIDECENRIALLETELAERKSVEATLIARLDALEAK